MRQIVHGTDTLAYTASALSLMLAGFSKPIVITGIPLSWSLSDVAINMKLCSCLHGCIRRLIIITCGSIGSRLWLQGTFPNRA